MAPGVWPRIVGLIPVKRRSKWELEEVVNAMLYVLKNGGGWRDIPGEFPCWNTGHYYCTKWGKEGVWENINACLLVDYREKPPTAEKKTPNQAPFSSMRKVSKTPPPRPKKSASMAAN